MCVAICVCWLPDVLDCPHRNLLCEFPVSHCADGSPPTSPLLQPVRPPSKPFVSSSKPLLSPISTTLSMCPATHSYNFLTYPSLDLLPTALSPRTQTTLDLELVVCGHNSSLVISCEPQGPGTRPCQLWKGLTAAMWTDPGPALSSFWAEVDASPAQLLQLWQTGRHLVAAAVHPGALVRFLQDTPDSRSQSRVEN